jgi:hypothetical protein
MGFRRLAVLVAAGAALALPGRALAVDHVVLYVSPAKVGAGQLAPWNLSAAVVGAEAPAARETFGVSLKRTFLSGRAEELHGFRAAPGRTVTFDGTTGRWVARFGSVTIDMTIAATGPARPIAESQGCRGDLRSVPVTLRGSFVLRTGTPFFRTIRRQQLRGTVTFNPGGAVECGPVLSDECTPSTVLLASRQASNLRTSTLMLSPDAGGWLTFTFADHSALGSSGSTWNHVMRVERLGFSPLAGDLPRIAVRLRAALPVSGSGTFTAPPAIAEPSGACRRTAVVGSFTGTFRTRFAGWGARSSTFRASDHARFARDEAEDS